MIYINHSFNNGFFQRVFDGSTAPRMRAQYSHLSHEYDHGIHRELPGDTTLFSAVPRDTRGSQRKRPRSIMSTVHDADKNNVKVKSYSYGELIVMGCIF